MLPQKKISILTLHDVPNYGSVLQTFATQEIFKGMGLNTNIIDYRRISSASLWQRICMVTQDDGLIKIWSSSCFRSYIAIKCCFLA